MLVVGPGDEGLHVHRRLDGVLDRVSRQDQRVLVDVGPVAGGPLLEDALREKKLHGSRDLSKRGDADSSAPVYIIRPWRAAPGRLSPTDGMERVRQKY